MRLPEGHAKRNTHTAKLRRAIYGMKEAGRLFFELLATVLLAAGFEQSTYDPCLFYCAFGILLAHVDDCLILGDESFIDRIFAFVKRKFNITTTGFNEEVDFIGCWIRWNGSVLEVSQEAYIDKILARFDLEDCREYSSPLTPGTVLYPSETPCDFPVFSWNGSLMFCRLTRFDILYALNQFSRVAHAPSIVAKQQMLRCFGYLKATKKFALRFYPCDVSDLKLTVMSDSDWASNHADRKSVGGDLIYLGPSIVGFLCRTQSVVAPSSQSAEVIQVYVAVKRLKWIKAMLEEMELTPLEKVVPVLTDSDNAVKAICTITDRNKHLGLYIAYIRDLIKRKVMSLHHISREWNYADLFTKQDDIKDYQRFRKLAREPLSIEYVDNKQGGMKDFQKYINGCEFLDIDYAIIYVKRQSSRSQSSAHFLFCCLGHIYILIIPNQITEPNCWLSSFSPHTHTQVSVVPSVPSRLYIGPKFLLAAESCSHQSILRFRFAFAIIFNVVDDCQHFEIEQLTERPSVRYRSEYLYDIIIKGGVST